MIESKSNIIGFNRNECELLLACLYELDNLPDATVRPFIRDAQGAFTELLRSRLYG